MSHVLPHSVVEELRKLRDGGASQRRIARELGIAKNTVARYVRDDDGAVCACGGPAGHRGWCRARYAKSTKRQAFHAARRGVHVEVLPEKVRSRITETTNEKRVWLGLEQGFFARLPFDERYGAIGEVHRETRAIKPEHRDDVRQEMIVACFEGRLARHDIARAVMTFYSFVMHGNVWRNDKEIQVEKWDMIEDREAWVAA